MVRKGMPFLCLPNEVKDAFGEGGTSVLALAWQPHSSQTLDAVR